MKHREYPCKCGCFGSSKTAKLFEAFERLRPVVEFEGMGNRPRDVQHVVLRHGGKGWAESRPDQGATFYLSLAEEEKLAERGSN